LAAMITLHYPAPHQKIPTESEANHPVVTANGFCKQLAGTMAAMLSGIKSSIQNDWRLRRTACSEA